MADIFSKSNNQELLDGAISKDFKNFYYRSPYDYNAFDHENSFEFIRSITLGVNHYDLPDSLKNRISKYEYNPIDLSSNQLLALQYSSPATADLYKHLETIGYLRLMIRYQQFKDVEDSLHDPLISLQKQAIYDCIKKDQISKDIDQAISNCVDFNQLENRSSFYQLLEPGEVNGHITHKTNITKRALNRVNTEGRDLEDVNKIIPMIQVDQNNVYLKMPNQASRELISNIRFELVGNNNIKGYLVKLIDYYKEHHQMPSMEQEGFNKLQVFGVPITEEQVKNLLLLDDNSRYLALNLIASNLAYLRVIDAFLLASDLINKVMLDPGIQAGYKPYFQKTLDYIQYEIVKLEKEKDRLRDYASSMRYLLNESDKRRDQQIEQIKREYNNDTKKRVINLTV